MKRILIAALIAAAGSALADPVARAANGDSVRLTNAECPAQIAEKANPGARDRLRKAVASIGGKQFLGCWIRYEALRGYLLRYEDDDEGFIPEADVHEETGA